MIYQKLVDNALWGKVQPKDEWRDFATKVKEDKVENASNGAAETYSSTSLDRVSRC